VLGLGGGRSLGGGGALVDDTVGGSGRLGGGGGVSCGAGLSPISATEPCRFSFGFFFFSFGTLGSLGARMVGIDLRFSFLLSALVPARLALAGGDSVLLRPPEEVIDPRGRRVVRFFRVRGDGESLFDGTDGISAPFPVEGVVVVVVVVTVVAGVVAGVVAVAVVAVVDADVVIVPGPVDATFVPDGSTSMSSSLSMVCFATSSGTLSRLRTLSGRSHSSASINGFGSCDFCIPFLRPNSW